MHHVSEFKSVPLRRRTFLIGAATTGILAACGSDDGGAPVVTAGDTAADNDATDDTSVASEPAAAQVVADQYAGESAELEAGTFNLIQRFPSNVQTLGEVRLPFSLSSAEAEFVSDGPLSLGAQVTDLDGNAVGPRLEARRRDVAPSPYYAFRTQIDTAGVYGLLIDGGPETGANFQIFESADVALPQPGQPLPAFDTPTFSAPGDVDPICTRDPICDFHEVTLTEALAAGRPVAYFVGTPAFCQTGSCTPALEAIVDVAGEYADAMTFVHAEVWTDLTATTIAPAVLDLAIEFEPALFITAADGTIVERLDGLWNVSELRERLDAALA